MERKLTDLDRRPRQSGWRAEGHRQPAQSGVGDDAPAAGRDLSAGRHHAQHGDHPAEQHPLLQSDEDFLREAARLDNYNDWMQAERSSGCSIGKGHIYDRTQPLLLPLRVLTNAQLPLLKVVALYFDKVTLLDPSRRELRDHWRESLLDERNDGSSRFWLE
jgi:hypothetical protein